MQNYQADPNVCAIGSFFKYTLMWGQTPLCFAAVSGQLDILEILVEEFEVPILYRDCRGCTCFHAICAARSDDLSDDVFQEVVSYLADNAIAQGLPDDNAIAQ